MYETVDNASVRRPHVARITRSIGGGKREVGSRNRDYDPIFTQPRTCEMGSSIFAAMRRLKLLSTTRASFGIMPTTERRNEKMFPFLVAILTVLVLVGKSV